MLRHINNRYMWHVIKVALLSKFKNFKRWIWRNILKVYFENDYLVLLYNLRILVIAVL